MINESPHTYRFAPSPTGVLHVGGARTAIFNWLLAKQNSGKFLLRLEDTDRKRSTPESIEQIKSSLHWLGLSWDEEPVYQSQRLKRHREVVQILLESGHAYPCFCTKEELDQKRAQIQDRKGAYLYDRTCRHLPQQQVQKNYREGLPFTVRLKIHQGITRFQDAVHGEHETPNAEIDDFIIMRTDSTPVYQIAVVVDDHDMSVTHVIRGDDHLKNTAKQIQIYNALQWPLPQFAHLPLILGPDRERLSKRHGAASVEEFKQSGILADALFNFLCLLGWAPGDDTELMDRKQLTARFSINRVNKANAVFDFQKLMWMNSQYLNRLSSRDLMNSLPEPVRDQVNGLNDIQYEKLLILIDLVKQRAKTTRELADGIGFFLNAPDEYDQSAVDKHFSEEAARYLEDLIVKLNDLPDFTEAETEGLLRNMAKDLGTKLGTLVHPIRLSLTGRAASPGIFEVMTILGRKEVIQRLQKAISYIRND